MARPSAAVRKEIETIARSADACRERRECVEAERLYITCYEQSDQHRYRQGIGLALMGLGTILLYRDGAYVDAYCFFDQAEKLFGAGYDAVAREYRSETKRAGIKHGDNPDEFKSSRTSPTELMRLYQERYKVNKCCCRWELIWRVCLSRRCFQEQYLQPCLL